MEFGTPCTWLSLALRVIRALWAGCLRYAALIVAATVEREFPILAEAVSLLMRVIESDR